MAIADGGMVQGVGEALGAREWKRSIENGTENQLWSCPALGYVWQ